MKSLKQYILENKLITFVVTFFDKWVRHWDNSQEQRFLLNKKERKDMIKFIESQDKCNEILYRATYLNYGNIENTPVGGTYYEPLISTSESERFVNKILKQNADYNIKSNKSDDNKLLTKLIIKPGSQSINIDNFINYGQFEWVACGKFKVISKKTETFKWENDFTYKRYSTKINVITIEQVFDESLTDIFEKLKPLKNNYKKEKQEIML